MSNQVKSLATIHTGKTFSIDTTGDGKVRLKFGPMRARLTPAQFAQAAKKVAEAEAKGVFKKAQAQARELAKAAKQRKAGRPKKAAA